MPRATPLALFAQADFRRIWLIGALSGVVRWLELLAFGVYTYDLTGSPLLVALITLLRMLPLAVLGAITGAISERLGHRRTLTVSLLVQTAVSAGLAGLALLDQLTLWHLAVGTVAGGIYWTTDLPTRRNMMGSLAGSERIAVAMSIDAATSNVTRAIGPALGGLLLAMIGISGALVLSMSLYAIAVGLMLLTSVTVGADERQAGRNLWQDLVAGLRYAAGNRALVGTLAITVIFNIWLWPYTAMIPVIGRDVLMLDAFLVGVLMSAEGIGALLGSLTAANGRNPSQFRKLYAGGLLLALLAAIALSRADTPLLAGMAILAAGLGAGSFSAMQATLIYTLSPPEVRSRMLGVLSVCIGAAPIGYAHMGLLADWIGATDAVLVSGIEGLAMLLIAWAIWPEIR